SEVDETHHCQWGRQAVKPGSDLLLRNKVRSIGQCKEEARIAANHGSDLLPRNYMRSMRGTKIVQWNRNKTYFHYILH
ncbi:hypothetical protein J6590_027280, partial [Homalodisca vitripennis]